MAFQVNQGSNANHDWADILADGIRLVHIEKASDKQAVISVYTDGQEPTHVIDLAVKLAAGPIGGATNFVTEEHALRVMKKAKVEVPVE
jgi:hypothetical protein